ncbi:MAG: FRG domain-containing protein [Pseudomonadota bacterium]
MTIETASSWADLYELLFHDSKNDRLNRYKSRYAFRGVSSASYAMQTSIMRQGGEFGKTESHILRQFKKYAYQEMGDHQNEWYWLAVGQHYGLPTRLLDWSYSPDVALHFATANTSKMDDDGAVWMVNYKELHKKAPPKIRGVMEAEKTWILTTELMSEGLRDLAELDELGHKEGDFILFFEPPALDARIYNQFAYFSVASRVDLGIDAYLTSSTDIPWRKIVIPASLKWEVRDKLDQRNISERVLFPGLGGLADWLKRYYLPTGSAS